MDLFDQLQDSRGNALGVGTSQCPYRANRRISAWASETPSSRAVPK